MVGKRSSGLSEGDLGDRVERERALHFKAGCTDTVASTWRKAGESMPVSAGAFSPRESLPGMGWEEMSQSH